MSTETTKAITIEAISKESFEPFGDLIMIDQQTTKIPINHGFGFRFPELARVENTSGATAISIIRGEPQQLPLQIKLMERHPLGSQAFMPLSSEPYLAIVAPAGPLDLEKIRAFLVTDQCGVNYKSGVWHHFCCPINKTMDFLVVDRIGPGSNCDEYRVPEQIQLIIERA